MAKKTTAPNHAKLVNRNAVGIFGAGRDVPGIIMDTTVTDKGVVCVSLDVTFETDSDCDGIWTSQWRLDE